MQKFVGTQVELAKACGVTKRSITTYTHEPGFPAKTDKGYPVGEVLAWILDHSSKEEVVAGVDGRMADLKKWDVYERARKTRITNDIREGRMVLRSEVERMVSTMVAACQNLLLSLPSRLAPDLAGRTVAEIEAILTDAITEAISKLRSGK